MNILEQILRDTAALVARRKVTAPVEMLKDQPYFDSPALGLARSLRGERLGVIAELKKASPSRGVIRADFDVRELAIQYKLGGASAISVLTEPGYFAGSLQNLALARRTVDLPLLRKDFVLDRYQLFEARAYGADAVLLIAAALDPAHLADLYEEACEMGLSCLVEVHSTDELDGLDLDRIEIIGVNNRDLKTFQGDINRSLDVFAHLPRHTVRVSESGLRRPETLAHLRRNGADAVLIGETFMTARRPGEALSLLCGETEALLSSTLPPLRLVG